MKGSKAVIDELNARLAGELTGITQYVTHSAMCSNWGYGELAKYIMGRAREEMGHADLLIDRILFLEGMPNIRLNHVVIGEDVKEMMEVDRDTEKEGIDGYTKSIIVCFNEKDHGTRQLFEQILNDEERHIDKIEEQLSQISQMKIENYLTEQIG